MVSALKCETSDRSTELLVINSVATILMVLFALLRLAVRFKINPRLGWSDYWLILALITAIVAHSAIFYATDLGLGCTVINVTRASRQHIFFLTHVGGSLNMYAMYFAKLSVCAYLLALNFSTIYRHTLYVSIVVLTITGFILPMITHWWNCRPLAATWDTTVHPRKCLMWELKVVVTFLQGAVNVATDFLYAAAPLIYLRRVKLTRYAQVGVQGVFLLALLGTAISIAKPIYYSRINLTPPDHAPFSSFITTMNLSNAENSACIVLACLPPLRRTFDHALKKILPEKVLDAIGATNAHTVGLGEEAGSSWWSKEGVEGDEESEGGANGDEGSDTGILEAELIVDARGRIVRV